MRQLPAVIICAVFVLASGACSSPDAPSGKTPPANSATSPSPSAEPKSEAGAKAAADLIDSRFAAQDWAGTWDLYDAAGQKAISRADFVRLKTACPGITGAPFVFKSIRAEGDAYVILRERGGFSFSDTFVYENGHWRKKVPSDALAEYATGVDKLIEARRAAGSCG